MKPCKRLYYTSMFFLEAFGLNRRCETFSGFLIILILFTNKIVACVRTPPPLKKGKGVSTQAIKTLPNFIHSHFVRK